MKRQVERVETALRRSLDADSLENFMRLLTSSDKVNLLLAMCMMKGFADATAKEMRAMYAYYVLVPILRRRYGIHIKLLSDTPPYTRSNFHFTCWVYSYISYLGDNKLKEFARSVVKNWKRVQYFYIKKFAQCTKRELDSIIICNSPLEGTIWGGIEFEILQSISSFHKTSDIFYNRITF